MRDPVYWLPLLLALALSACHSGSSSGSGDDAGTDTGTGSDSETDSETESDLCDDFQCPDPCLFHVDVNVAEPGDGLTWDTALATVQDGLDAAFESTQGCCPCEVWVAVGTYYIYETDVEDAVVLQPLVELYGGFCGGETSLGERSLAECRAILDGRDGPDGELHVRHVVTGDDEAVLDGFMIVQAGDEDQSGWGSGGVSVYWPYGLGPAAWVSVRNCIIRDNHGSGVRNSGYVVIENSLLINNAGRAVYNDYDSSAGILNCTIVNNGGAVYNSAGDDINSAHTGVKNSILWGNSVEEIGLEEIGAGLPYSPELTTTVSNSVVQGGFEGDDVLDLDPLFVDADSGDFSVLAGSPCIDSADGHYAPELDIDGKPRFDDPDTPNTGSDDPDYVDIGAYEYQGAEPDAGPDGGKQQR